MPRRSRSTTTESVSFIEEEAAHSDDNDDSKEFLTQTQFTFSQQPADKSQNVDTARTSEQKKLDDLNPTTRNKIVTDLSRMLLFKALGMRDPIDKTKVCSEALGEVKGVSKAALNEADRRLKDVFGFGVKHVNPKMEGDLPARFKNRLYLINEVVDDAAGTHSLNLHSAHKESMTERGLLMVVLSFAFCKGTSAVRSGQMKGAGKKTRWITEHHLYSLLHRVDENIPSEPPSAEGRKKSRSNGGRQSLGGTEGGVGETPDIDALLEKFVMQDYLLRDKIDEGDESAGKSEDGKVIAYAMGPRAAMEVGRRQVVFFCSNVLDEQPDPTMLREIDEDDEASEEEEEEVEGEEEVVEEQPKKRGK
eukprot:CAMPEP_0201692782 /NCGR_PEP_ID=MMETSP0578-20130828/5575_1 /ASSEMBLY_ACC=CAM_ASM_000663 /TAXON_ID=267565 /ORGANISM="Skeletonema grethea, Strain CCMP 1804" /LENGTH=361 /DNA_ID=CAMNT_0048178207 /DNA_START=108 /DNA_END=1190 /DNA_ORIENTATION=-